jgi:putative transcriptional regulator
VTPRHHPSAAVLADYAAGAQRPAFAAITAAHLESCTLCREEVSVLEEVGGVLMSQVDPAPLEGDSTARILARLDAAEPAPVRTASKDLVNRIRFGRRRWIGPGVWLRHAEKDACGPDLLYMLHVPARMAIFSHSHDAAEHVAVIKGGFTDETGAFTRGDFAELAAGVEHRPVADEDGDCVCLVASEEPMLMRTWMGRFFQTLAKV